MKMNINDITEKIEVPENIWPEIFAKQRLLAAKYVDIEGMGDLLETTANNVDTEKGQKWIKDFAWRVTEELAEANEAWEYYCKEGDTNPDSSILDGLDEHYKEELADALHFMVELTIIAGYDHTIIDALNPHVPDNAWDIIYPLGLLCNTLKNKPWKQTQMLTDRANFEKYLKLTWAALIAILIMSMDSKENIYLYYFKKNKINQFRQRSKY